MDALKVRNIRYYCKACQLHLILMLLVTSCLLVNDVRSAEAGVKVV